jgi:hypothetical protein
MHRGALANELEPAEPTCLNRFPVLWEIYSVPKVSPSAEANIVAMFGRQNLRRESGVRGVSKTPNLTHHYGVLRTLVHQYFVSFPVE